MWNISHDCYSFSLRSISNFATQVIYLAPSLKHLKYNVQSTPCDIEVIPGADLCLWFLIPWGFPSNYISVPTNYCTYNVHAISPLPALALFGVFFPIPRKTSHFLPLESLNYLLALTRLSSPGSQPDAYFQVPWCNAQWVFLPPVYHISINHLLLSLS